MFPEIKNLPGEIKKIDESLDGSAKFLIEFSDGLSVETVLLPFHKRATICLSSQVGCRMNCSFCLTGKQGLRRHLLSSEILAQYLLVSHYLFKRDEENYRAPRIVFMGQGEPLHNFDELKEAIKSLLDPRKYALGPSQITVSTVGYLPGLLRFNELGGVNLAFSLHSPIEAERNEMIPIGRVYSLEEIMKSLEQIKLRRSQYLNFEYLVLKDKNHSEEHAEKLAQLIKERKAFVNLIYFNPFEGSSFLRPSLEEVSLFKKKLVSKRVRVMVRESKGRDIMAACGQLNSSHLKNKNLEKDNRHDEKL